VAGTIAQLASGNGFAERDTGSRSAHSLLHLRLGVFAAPDQHIATRYQLAPVDLAESAQYLRHHLALVGRTDPLFAADPIGRAP
jgi:type II secretory pathway predicted ATPase ExeA